MTLLRIASYLIVKHSCVREEFIDLPFFLQTQLQQITVKQHLFGEFALATLTFGPCTSPSDTPPFTYPFPYVCILIRNTLNRRPICEVDNFQLFQRQINFLDNPCCRRCSHFRFLYTLDSSSNLFWCRENEAHISLLRIGSLHVYQKTFQDAMTTKTVQDVSIEAII